MWDRLFFALILGITGSHRTINEAELGGQHSPSTSETKTYRLLHDVITSITTIFGIPLEPPRRNTLRTLRTCGAADCVFLFCVCFRRKSLSLIFDGLALKSTTDLSVAAPINKNCLSAGIVTRRLWRHADLLSN